MPIRYASQYAPKHYNPNWSSNSLKRQAWDNQKKKMDKIYGPVGVNNSKKLASSINNNKNK
jgi:hypothetical protein